MPDYMFLLESRLSPEQRAVLERVQELSRSQDLNIYLTGGAVRDLISGQPIRDLDFTIEMNGKVYFHRAAEGNKSKYEDWLVPPGIQEFRIRAKNGTDEKVSNIVSSEFRKLQTDLIEGLREVEVAG